MPTITEREPPAEKFALCESLPAALELGCDSPRRIDMEGLAAGFGISYRSVSGPPARPPEFLRNALG